jgi:pimeloyl-ACP methyl ester carboxylesterase
LTPSANWPNVAPGEHGSANAFSPKYCRLDALVDIQPKPPILWIQAADDLIVSDNSFFDFGVLGAMGLVPGWPGADVYPAQPMVKQTRYVLEAYKAKGGAYSEHVVPDSGHCVYINQPEAFQKLLNEFLTK